MPKASRGKPRHRFFHMSLAEIEPIANLRDTKRRSIGVHRKILSQKTLQRRKNRVKRHGTSNDRTQRGTHAAHAFRAKLESRYYAGYICIIRAAGCRCCARCCTLGGDGNAGRRHRGPGHGQGRAEGFQFAEFSKVAGPFQKSFADLLAKKGKVPDADLKAAADPLVPQLAAMEPAVKSPLDRLIFGDWERQLGSFTNDSALTAKGLQNMVDSGQLQPNQVATVSAMLGQMAYVAKDYPTAEKVLLPLMSDPKVDDAVPQMLAESYASTGQPSRGWTR